jgi:glycosyltransferase involved in cell wall biosynthesis
MTPPLISVVMPVYNGERHLKEAIDSILSQTIINFEFIILNDGSKDKTAEIVQSYSDPRIRYIKNENNLQIAKTLNKGIQLAKGKYIARMDADDISLPSRFEIQVNFLEKNPSIGLVGSFYKKFGTDDKTIKLPTSNDEIRVHMLFNNPFGHPTVMFRRDIVQINNLYYDNYRAAQDYYYFYCFSKLTQLANINQVLLRYRVHHEQISTAKIHEQKKNADQIRSLILKDQVTVDETDCYRHNLFSQSAVYDKKVLLVVTSWAEKLININIKSDDNIFEIIVTEKYKALFRRSARVYGPSLYPIYWNFKHRQKFDITELKFFTLLYFSWVKYRFSSKNSDIT